jgi:hypothetical protein
MHSLGQAILKVINDQKEKKQNRGAKTDPWGMPSCITKDWL